MKKSHTFIASLCVAAFLTAGLAQQGDVVAEGFNGPQGVTIGPDGDIWVIDAGMGGDEREITAFFPNVGEEVTATYGDSARIVRLTPEGEQTVVAHLPSILTGQEATGGARLAFLDGTLYATNGFWVGPAGDEAADLMASVVRVDDGGVTEVANTWPLERDRNPAGFILESHPYGLTAGPDGRLWVADAGANTLLAIDPASGEVSVEAVFDEGIPTGEPNPARDGAEETDPVPTAVVIGEDGVKYVSFLSGVPFLPGSAKVVRVDSDGDVSDYATGLSTLTDLRLGPDGEMYAVSFSASDEPGMQPNTGAVVRVREGEASELVVEGLPFPTAIDFDAEGDAYVTTNGVGAPGSGTVVRFDGLAAP